MEYGLKPGDPNAYPVSVNVVLNLARKADALGKKSRWFMRGGPERVEATALYRLATRLAFKIYGGDAL